MLVTLRGFLSATQATQIEEAPNPYEESGLLFYLAFAERFTKDRDASVEHVRGDQLFEVGRVPPGKLECFARRKNIC